METPDTRVELISHLPTGPARPTPILFVHGAWHAAWCWEDHFLPFFAAHGYPSYALSLRSHGGSPGPRRGNRIRDYVADVVEAVGRLPAPPILVGHSMGGLVVQKYLEEHPAPAGVLMASVPIRGAGHAFFLRLLPRYPARWFRALLTWRLYPFVDTPEAARALLFSPDLPPEVLAEYAPRLQDESYWAALDMLVLALPRPSRIKTPLMVLGGTNDALFGPDEVAATARAYRTEPVVLPGLAHDVMLETRWQEAAGAVLNWIGKIA